MRQLAENEAHVLFEAEIEQPVGFVDDQELDVLGLEYPLLEVVYNSARSADDDVGSLLKPLGLLSVVDAADHLEQGNVRISAQNHGFFENLARQLAGGSHDDGLGQAGLTIRHAEQPADDGHQECRRLAGTGMGLSRHVAAAQKHWKGLGLDRGAAFKPAFCKSFQYLRL